MVTDWSFCTDREYAILEQCLLPVLEACDPSITDDSVIIEDYMEKLVKINDTLICVDLPSVEVSSQVVVLDIISPFHS